MIQLQIGCIADDFTGAADAASFLKKGGMETVLTNGVPREEDQEELARCEAVVIALKTRTEESQKALYAVREAYDWFSRNGCERIFFKYCSTFDSSPRGNIGPAVDFLMEKIDVSFTILSPALPVNGRTVTDGGIFVDGVPLNESPMKNHPLTPMREYRIPKLMETQGKYDCLVCGREEMEKPATEIRKDLEEFGRGKNRFYVVPEYTKEDDARKIVETFGYLPLLTGSSGLMEELARRYHDTNMNPPIVPAAGLTRKDGVLILAGSCSSATQGQIEWMRPFCSHVCCINAEEVLEDCFDPPPLDAWAKDAAERPVLIYSSASSQEVERARESSDGKISGKLEDLFAVIAKYAAFHGYGGLIVAGGETSGAVTRALGLRTYRIGETIAPGIPVMFPSGRENLRLVLKSGNFGDRDFFLKAVKLLHK